MAEILVRIVHNIAVCEEVTVRSHGFLQDHFGHGIYQCESALLAYSTLEPVNKSVMTTTGTENTHPLSIRYQITSLMSKGLNWPSPCDPEYP